MDLSSIKNLNPKQKLILTAATGTLVCFFIYLTMHFTATDIKKLKMNIVDQKINLEKQENMSENTIRLSDKLKKIEPQLEKFNQIFIKKNRELEFITALEDIAGRNAVAQNIELPPPSKDNKKLHNKSNLSLNARGLYSNVMNYLAEIESLNYYINIDSIVIGAAQKIDTNTRRTPRINDEPGTTDAVSADGDVYIKIKAEAYWK